MDQMHCNGKVTGHALLSGCGTTAAPSGPKLLFRCSDCDFVKLFAFKCLNISNKEFRSVLLIKYVKMPFLLQTAKQTHSKSIVTHSE